MILPLWLQKSWGPWTTYGGGGFGFNTARGGRNWAFLGWQAQYREVQAHGSFPDVDMDALLTLLLAMELGLGILEATGVDLPEPSAWSATVRRVLEGIQ